MTRAERSRLVTLITAGCFAWLLGIGFLMWKTLPEVEHHGSSAVKDRMAAECQGSFNDRYKCKEAIIVESGRESFFMVAGRFLLVIVPPMVASILLSGYLRRHPVRAVEHHVAAHDDWKNRAQSHVTHVRPMDEDPPPPQFGKHPIEDIAPLDDWKTRAQEHISKRRD